jgi:hypothetical protein
MNTSNNSINDLNNELKECVVESGTKQIDILDDVQFNHLLQVLDDIKLGQFDITKFNDETFDDVLMNRLLEIKSQIEIVVNKIKERREDRSILKKLDELKKDQKEMVDEHAKQLYGAHDFPLLPTIKLIKNPSKMEKIKNLGSDLYRIQFLCTKCGKSPSGDDLILKIPTQEIRHFFECLKWAIFAIEIAVILSGAPIPHFSKVVADFKEVFPDVANSDVEKYDVSEKLSLKVTPNQVYQIKMLLIALNKDAMNVGLEKVVRCDNTSTWVCKGAAHGVQSQCYQDFISQGESCLLLKINYD